MLEKIQEAVRNGSINYADTDGQTILHVAAKTGNFTILSIK